MQCPSFNFPAMSVPRSNPLEGEPRDLFHDYGRISGMCPVTKDGVTKLVFQRSKSREGPVLCASGPVLPLLPPNDCLLSKEPCLSGLKKSVADVLVYVDRLRRMNNKTYIHKLKNADVEIFGPNSEPTNLRKTITELAEFNLQYKDNPRIPVVNTDYAGGCMSAMETRDINYLCFPSGPEMDLLALCELKTEGRPVLKRLVRQRVQKIFQVDTAVVNDICHIGVRTENKCLLYKVRHSEEGVNFKRRKKLAFRTKPMSISMSPFIEGECLTLTSGGALQVWDAHGGQAAGAGEVTPRFNDPYTEGQPGTAVYSAHPRQAVLTDRTGVAVWDFRIGARSEDVFVLPNYLLRKEERIFSGCRHPTNPFYHIVATDETLLMIDHRFPKLPVLQCRHPMAAPPMYMSVVSKAVPQTGDDVLLVASQDHTETLCYQVNMSSPHLPPVTTCSPWRLAKPEDLYNLAGAPTVEKAVVDERLSAPLVGLAAVHNKDGGGFCAAQLTSYGDLFGQGFVIGERDMEKTWCSGPGSSHFKLSEEDSHTATQWQNHVLALQKEQNEAKTKIEAEQNETSSTKATEKKKYMTTHMPHLLHMLTKEEGGNTFCQLCRDTLCLGSTPQKRKEREGGRCSRCNRPVDLNKTIYKAAKMNRASPGMVDDLTVDMVMGRVSLEPVRERFASAKSRLLLYNWQGKDVTDLGEEAGTEDAEIERILSKTERYSSQVQNSGSARNKMPECRVRFVDSSSDDSASDSHVSSQGHHRKGSKVKNKSPNKKAEKVQETIMANTGMTGSITQRDDSSSSDGDGSSSCDSDGPSKVHHKKGGMAKNTSSQGVKSPTCDAPPNTETFNQQSAATVLDESATKDNSYIYHLNNPASPNGTEGSYNVDSICDSLAIARVEDATRGLLTVDWLASPNALEVSRRRRVPILMDPSVTPEPRVATTRMTGCSAQQDDSFSSSGDGSSSRKVYHKEGSKATNADLPDPPPAATSVPVRNVSNHAAGSPTKKRRIEDTNGTFFTYTPNNVSPEASLGRANSTPYGDNMNISQNVSLTRTPVRTKTPKTVKSSVPGF